MTIFDTLNRLLGDPNEKELKKLRPAVGIVREFEKRSEIQSLTLETLPKKTLELKEKITKELEKRGEGALKQILEEILPEAFATAIRACELLVGQKVSMGKQEFLWDMVPFDVQIIGGAALHRGNIAEMRTGEGKTLVCTLPVYLNALIGRGVHVVTVNDYLARRDSTWMGMLYKALGLTVGCVVHGLTTQQRREAYGSDITYGTNNEFGFDYLRDNMTTSLKRQVQRGLHYAIVDEVDSILIDEARTPLIISQPAEESTSKYLQYAQLVGNLQENVHYNKDEKQRTAVLTEEGIKKMEELMGVENIYTEKGFEEVHHIEQALRAHAIYKLDVDYVVKENQIIIVDEFTGRLMPGRRYGHGLHQAIEAKEGVEVQRESKTLATITFQNYFRLYKKLAGMTGTAKTEEEEFESIYKLRTIVIPTHRAMIRNDKADAVYRTVSAKFKAVAVIAEEKFKLGQPVLIGTTSIEKSEAMSLLLQEKGVLHQVLNAKQHEKEAEIVAKAGQKGAITIATNMAGRGTDIKLGEGVKELGGLAILGTERHEARRIDNQLRGRSGRQGDPGESRFFVSMEDDLMRLFGGDRLKAMMERLNVPDDVPLENAMVSRSIESAQKKVEGHHFDVRRHVLQYDDVMNKHRDIIYKRRQKILERIAESESAVDNGQRTVDNEKSIISNQKSVIHHWPLHDEILKAMRGEATRIVDQHALSDDPEQWDLKEMMEAVAALHADFAKVITVEKLKSFQERESLEKSLTEFITSFYEDKCANASPEAVARAESLVTLRSIDSHWMNHIDDMAHLREQVAFSGYAQRDPLIEYQDQGFRRMQQLIGTIDAEIARMLIQADFGQFISPTVMLEAEEEEPEGLATNEAEIEGALTETGVSRGSLIEAGKIENARLPDGQGKLKMENANQQRLLIRADPQGSPQRKPIANSQLPIAKIGRNDPCPCGSGKKYKKCHGKNA